MGLSADTRVELQRQLEAYRAEREARQSMARPIIWGYSEVRRHREWLVSNARAIHRLERMLDEPVD